MPSPSLCHHHDHHRGHVDTWHSLRKHFTKPYEVIVYNFRMGKLRHGVANNLPCKEWGCISNSGSLTPAIILRVPDETGLVRLEMNERLLDAIGGNSVCGWSDLS